MNEDYLTCQRIALNHLEKRANVSSDFVSNVSLEYFTLRYGNQLFLIRLLCENVSVPGSIQDFLALAKHCHARACFFPLKKEGKTWTPVCKGWGLIDAQTKKAISPPLLITDEKIALTQGELHDLAVRFVRNQLQASGQIVRHWDGSPFVLPSIWFNEKEWIFVQALRYPQREIPLPQEKIEALKPYFQKLGYVAFVSFASENLKSEMYRGESIRLFYEGYYPIADFFSRCSVF